MIWFSVIILGQALVAQVSSSTDEITVAENLMKLIQKIQQKLHEIRSFIVSSKEDWCRTYLKTKSGISLAHLQECAGYEIFVKQRWISTMNPILFELRHYRRTLLNVNHEMKVLSPHFMESINDFIGDEENILNDARNTVKLILELTQLRNQYSTKHVDAHISTVIEAVNDKTEASTAQMTTTIKQPKSNEVVPNPRKSAVEIENDTSSNASPSFGMLQPKSSATSKALSRTTQTSFEHTGFPAFPGIIKRKMFTPISKSAQPKSKGATKPTSKAPMMLSEASRMTSLTGTTTVKPDEHSTPTEIMTASDEDPETEFRDEISTSVTEQAICNVETTVRVDVWRELPETQQYPNNKEKVLQVSEPQDHYNTTGRQNLFKTFKPVTKTSKNYRKWRLTTTTGPPITKTTKATTQILLLNYRSRKYPTTKAPISDNLTTKSKEHDESDDRPQKKYEEDVGVLDFNLLEEYVPGNLNEKLLVEDEIHMMGMIKEDLLSHENASYVNKTLNTSTNGSTDMVTIANYSSTTFTSEDYSMNTSALSASTQITPSAEIKYSRTTNMTKIYAVYPGRR